MKSLEPDSFIVKVAYYFREDDDALPKQTSLCALFWRFVFHLICIPIAWAIYAVWFVVASILGFAAGYRLKTEAEMSTNKESNFTPIQRWPKFLGVRVTIVNLVILVGIIVALALSVRALFRVILSLPHWSISTAAGVVGVLLLILLQKKTKVLSLTWEFLKATKRGLCPIITIVDGPVSS